MNQNPNIPQLFRNIFNQAYLPYRDPETLKLFLKEISYFDYSHSEKLGDAFEYLLSFMGTQGDAGQFRTPRHIIDFIVAAVNPQKYETVLDPACGTAGFLISAYKHIMKANSKNGNGNGNQLTPTERKRLLTNFTGYDISPDMVRLSLVNLYLHGFQDPKIVEYDTLTSEERWNDSADVILANPPFMTPKGGIRPHKRFSIQAKRSEVLFVDYIAEHLNPGGRAGVIVPEGIIFQSSNAYKALRKMLLEDYLWAVVSLPAGVFQPYSGVKTSILLIDKNKAKKNDSILFIKVENDGFDLGAQRRPIDKNDLPNALQTLTHYHQYCHSDDPSAGEEESQELVDEILHYVQNDNAHLIEKSKIADSGDWNLSGERYRIDQTVYSDFETVPLSDLCEFNNGLWKGKKEPFIEAKIIRNTNFRKDGFIDWSDIAVHEVEVRHLEKRTLQYGDIILEKSGGGPTQPVGRVVFFNGNGDNYSYSNFTSRIRVVDNRITPNYLWLVLRDFYLKGGTQEYQKQTSGIRNLDFKLYQQIQIPLPPLSVQEEIVAEIDGYQKIIDGARQVVDNYKPTIKIDPDWEMVELGDVCEINPKKSETKNLPENTMVSFVPMAIVNENNMDFQPEVEKSISEVYSGYTYFKDDDVVLARVTPCFENGKAGIAKNLKNGIGFGSSEYFVIRPNENILPVYIYLLIIKDSFRKVGVDQMTGTGGLQRVPKDYLSHYKIPLPPLSVQQDIVAQIEAEQKIVNGNKKLIEIYEQKIKDKIGEVWGE